MAVLAILSFDGNGDDLVLAYEAASEDMRHIPDTGLICHAAAKTESGLIMTDVWESEELLGAYMAHPAFVAATCEHAMPEPQVRVYQTANVQLGAAPPVRDTAARA